MMRATPRCTGRCGKRNAFFELPFLHENAASFYQDRLGTSIGKVDLKLRSRAFSFLQAAIGSMDVMAPLVEAGLGVHDICKIGEAPLHRSARLGWVSYIAALVLTFDLLCDLI
jgi:hypothetical protein